MARPTTGAARVGTAPAAPSSGLRRSVVALRALQGLRGHVMRALVPAVALALVAGGSAGAVTLVSLASTPVAPAAGPSLSTDDASGTTGTDDGASGPAGPSTGDDVPAHDLAPDGGDDGETGEEHEGPDAGSSTTGAALTFEEAVAEHGPPDYSAILTRRFPGSRWSLDGSSYAGLRWLDGAPMPTRAELDAFWPAVAEELAAERAAQEAAEAAAAAAREAELETRRNDPDVQAMLDDCDPGTIWGDPDYAHVLTRRFPGAQWSLNGNDPVDGLVWMSSGPRPTKAQLDAMWAEVAREMALEMDPEELARWCGDGDEVVVDGVARPRGWVGGADDEQSDPPAITRANCSIMPGLPNDDGGRTIDVWKDPTGAKNFDMVIGISFEELNYRISEAHGFWDGQHCGVAFSINGDRTFTWHSSRVDENIVVGILTALGALPANIPTPPPATEPEPEGDPEEEPASDAEAVDAAEATDDPPDDTPDGPAPDDEGEDDDEGGAVG